MATVTIDNYNSITGCIAFTITGSPTLVILDQSTNDFLTYTSDLTLSLTSPACGKFFAPNTKFRLRLFPGQETSNVIDNSVIITPIESIEDVSFVNSPIHIRLEELGITNVTLRLWLWRGALDQPLGSPNYVFKKDRVSAEDNYINIEISEQIKAFIIGKDNEPNFAYNELGLAAVSGQGVFWQVQADVETTTTIEQRNFRTSFATLGYRYNNEETFTLPSLWQDERIHDYFKQSFDFSQALEDATSSNIILKIPLTSTLLRESLNPYLIVYLDKDGLYQMFTPNSKVMVVENVKRVNNNISHRDPSRVNTSYVHSKNVADIDSTATYTIETGVLTEEMVEVVRQIVYSPKVYLIRFKGDFQETSTIGITIDNTFVTIDDTTITIDSETIESEYLGFFKSHEQIPVILKDTDFEKKNRVNDKNKIDYKLVFEVTNNTILDIR